MSLLLAGDSFATNGSKEESKSYGIPYYWHEEIATQLGYNWVSSATGGADIYYSTFTAIQKILNSDADITHALFFITDFHRDLLNAGEDIPAKVNLATDVSIADKDFYSRNIDESCISTGDKWNALGKVGVPLFRYFSFQSITKVYHAGLACLCQLESLCRNRGIDLIFVHTTFCDQIPFIDQYAPEMMTSYKTFRYVDALPNVYRYESKIAQLRQEWPGHMGPKEQPVLLKKFNEQFPGWLKSH